MAKKISPAIRSFFEKNGQPLTTTFDTQRLSSIDRFMATPGINASEVLNLVQGNFSHKYKSLSPGAQRELSKLIEKECK